MEPTDKQNIRKIEVKREQKNGDIYVFEQEYYYDSDKKYNRTVKTKLIGKIPKGSEDMVKTRPKRPARSKTEQDSQILTASRTRVGMMKIIEHIGEECGIDHAVLDSMDEGTAQKILSIARFLVGTGGDSLSRIENWQYTHQLPYSPGISEDVYHKLFQNLGQEEEYQQRFFLTWGSQFDENDAIAFDSTTESTYSQNIIDAQYGFNKDKDGLKSFKILTLYSLNKRLPLLFTKQPGYIADIVSIKNALTQMEALGIKSREIVSDNGFHSNKNLSEMLLAGFNFITLVKKSLDWIKPIVEDNSKELEKVTTLYSGDMRTHGICVPVMHTFEKERKYSNHKTGAEKGDRETFQRRVYVHVYFSRDHQTEEINKFDEDVFTIKRLIEEGTPIADLSADAKDIVKKYFTVRTRSNTTTVTIDTDKMEMEYKKLGYFVLVSNSNKDPFDCLQKYRKREWIENFFRSWGQNADGNRPRVWNSDTLRGKLFVQFIALCYNEAIYNKIRQIREDLKTELKNIEHGKKTEAKLLKELSVWMEKKTPLQMLQWFDMIEEVTVSTQLHHKRWNSETSERDRLFLTRMGVKLD